MQSLLKLQLLQRRQVLLKISRHLHVMLHLEIGTLHILQLVQRSSLVLLQNLAT